MKQFLSVLSFLIASSLLLSACSLNSSIISKPLFTPSEEEMLEDLESQSDILVNDEDLDQIEAQLTNQSEEVLLTPEP